MEERGDWGGDASEEGGRMGGWEGMPPSRAAGFARTSGVCTVGRTFEAVHVESCEGDHHQDVLLALDCEHWPEAPIWTQRGEG